MLTKITILTSTFIIGVLCAISGFRTDDPDMKNIYFGIFGSAVFALILGIIDMYSEHFRLSFLIGDYRRRVITNRKDQRDAHGAYEDLTDRYDQKGITRSISIKHNGEGEYIGTAYYELGEVLFTINLDKVNPKIGTGTYQYIKLKEGHKGPDIGTLHIQIDAQNKKIVYVTYSNLIPNGLASGYEIWER